MIKKEINLRAFFSSYDADVKKLTMVFLDTEIEAFTKSFLNSYYSTAQNNPIRDQTFFIKFDQKKSHCFHDKACINLVDIQDLLDKVVTVTVYIRHYNFMSNGKKIQGWSINLVSMFPS